MSVTSLAHGRDTGLWCLLLGMDSVPTENRTIRDC
jgi:hypothetical protein